jgi:hypothetical protein
VPRIGALDHLLATAVGHLFGYHGAARFDRLAERLRGVRADVLAAWTPAEPLNPAHLPSSVTEKVKEIYGVLTGGGADSVVNAGTAARLASALQALLGWLPADVFSRHHSSLLDGVVTCLSGRHTRALPADRRHQASSQDGDGRDLPRGRAAPGRRADRVAP